MGKVIIKFWGPGCMNCRALAPILESVKDDYKDIEFREVNTHTDPEAAEKYGVTTLPTLVFEKNGAEVGRMAGLRPKVLIVKKIQEVF